MLHSGKLSPYSEMTIWTKLARSKHSSFLYISVMDEGKKFCFIDTRPPGANVTKLFTTVSYEFS
jgi:hypothetical protein